MNGWFIDAGYVKNVHKTSSKEREVTCKQAIDLSINSNKGWRGGELMAVKVSLFEAAHTYVLPSSLDGWITLNKHETHP